MAEAAQHRPGGVGAHQPGVVGWCVFEALLEPGGQPVEVLFPVGQYTGGDHQPAQVVQFPRLWELVEQFVSKRLAGIDESGQDGGAVAVGQPLQPCLGMLGGHERVVQRAKLGRYLVVRPGEYAGEAPVEFTAGAPTFNVWPARLAAAGAGVGAGIARARAADGRLLGATDQRPSCAAPGARPWRFEDVVVAGGADRSPRPDGLHRARASTDHAVVVWSGCVAGPQPAQLRIGESDRAPAFGEQENGVVFAPLPAGAFPAARDRSCVAGGAQIPVVVRGALADASDLPTSGAATLRIPVTAAADRAGRGVAVGRAQLPAPDALVQRARRAVLA